MMDVLFDLSTVFNSDMVRLDTLALKRLNSRRCWAVPKVIDEMGALSAETQHLKRVLTTYEKLIDAADQVLYLMWRHKPHKPQYSQVIGILKTGRRNLYLYDGKTHTDGVPQCRQAEPVCVLDFYVHTALQRVGHGHRMFQFMLESEKIKAWQTAIDKPSDALLSFLEKHYGLSDAIWQMTNFVVFPAFFDPKLAPVPPVAIKPPSTPKKATEHKTHAARHSPSHHHRHTAADEDDGDDSPAANGSPTSGTSHHHRHTNAAAHTSDQEDGDDDSLERDSPEPPPRPASAHARTHTSCIASYPSAGPPVDAVDASGHRHYSPSPKTRAALLPSSPKLINYAFGGSVRLRTSVSTCSGGGSSTAGTGSMSDLSRQRKVASMGHQSIW